MQRQFLPGSFFRRAAAGLALLFLLTGAGLTGTGWTAYAQAGDATAAQAPAKKKSHAKTSSSTARSRHASRRTTRHRRYRASRKVRLRETARIRRAFVASSELRPMAQQLATLRTPAAYAGVTEFAERHSGDAAAAAYLALGHAYLLDHRYAEAVENFARARKDSAELGDIADFLAAEADHDSGNNADAARLLRGFAARYPDSIFVDQAPELEASVLLALNDPQAARQALAAAEQTDAADRVGYQLAVAQVQDALGNQAAAIAGYKQLLLVHPLSGEAQAARARLTALGAESTLTLAELRSLGDAYYAAGRYRAAEDQYRALLMHPAGLTAEERNTFIVAEAACQLKLHELTQAQAEALPDGNDENGARRLYLLMELARDRQDLAGQQQRVAELESRFPASPWLAEALYSSGNMYLLSHDFAHAVTYYGYLAEHFPASQYAASAHWRAGWLSYRLGQYQAASHIFDDQIKRYPSAPETVSALYWRGRLYENLDHFPSLAAANYRAIVRAYPNYYYAQQARARLAALGTSVQADHLQAAADPALMQFQALPAPKLVDRFPADSPHLAKARLLANAGLNEYVAPEIRADPDSDSWSALAEAQIYASYDETFRALRAMKRALPYASTAPIRALPLAYWRILFPEPWWATIRAEAEKNNLDPYLVASLIRQESEFNPNAVSYANAWGLMQLLPSTGRRMAREEGIRNFRTFQLLDPEMNIRLGTRYLREMIDRFGGVQLYALAAYNAGDNRVVDWQSAGPYSGMDEFVESIPFSETRNYVEAILRNEETYRAIDADAHADAAVTRASVR